MKLTELMEQMVANDDGKANYNSAFNHLKQISPIMKQAGMDVTIDTLSTVVGEDPETIQKIVARGINKGKLSQNIMGNSTGSDPLMKLAIDAFMVKMNRLGRMNVNSVSQRTGLSIDEIHDVIANDTKSGEHKLKDLIVNELKLVSSPENYKPQLWYGGEVERNDVYNPNKLTRDQSANDKLRMDMIHKAAHDMTNGFDPKYVGQISGQSIADKLKMDHRSIVTSTLNRMNKTDDRARQVKRFLSRETSIK